jgi:predicted dehydrogenase
MRGGALATTLVLDDTAVGHELSVYGTAGALHLDLCRFDGFQYARTDAPPGSARARARRLAETLRRPGESARAMRRGGDYRLTYEEQWRRFAAIVRGELPASPSLADGRQALAIALAATESAAVGARVAVNAEVAAQ